MSAQYKEIVRLTFRGERFEDHALDISALDELKRFQSIFRATARDAWLQGNPERKRVPRNFEQSMTLLLRNIEQGSTVVPLEIRTQPDLFGAVPPEATKAIQTVGEVYSSAHARELPPMGLRRPLLREYARLGESLAEDESIHVSNGGTREPVRVDREACDWLATFDDQPYADSVELTGHVVAVDTRNKRFVVSTALYGDVSAALSDDNEATVMEALGNRGTTGVRLRGTGSFSPNGKLQELDLVEGVTTEQRERPTRTPSEAIDDLTRRVDAEMGGTPRDADLSGLSADIDEELYGDQSG